MSSLPSDLPAQPSTTPTRVAGQESAPTTAVPPGPMGPSYAPAAETRTNTLAIVSLATGIGSFFAHVVPALGGFTVALIALITGYMARKQIKETGERGMGIATAGMIIGAAHLVLIALVIIGVLFLVFVLGIAFFSTSR